MYWQQYSIFLVKCTMWMKIVSKTSIKQENVCNNLCELCYYYYVNVIIYVKKHGIKLDMYSFKISLRTYFFKRRGIWILQFRKLSPYVQKKQTKFLY